MCALINGKIDPYEKALLALLLISYIQPFEDGNKRTSRLISNAILLAHGCCPLTYRSVDANDYRAALLLFYEQNNISAFKRIFVEQAEFAANEYF
jgi:Fic family protein